MRYSISKAGLGLLAVCSLTSCLTSCRKDEVKSLQGPVPTASFTAQVNASQYPATVTFTNTSADGFLYQWDFGDGSPLVTSYNATHTYKSPGGTYRVKLTVAGRGGTSVTPEQPVVIPDLCGNNGFHFLIDCDSTRAASWIFSDQPGAIKKYAADGTTLLASTSASSCQADDEFAFSSALSYSYTTGSLKCGAEADGKTDFVYKPNGALGQIVLQNASAFIGTSTLVRDNTYTIVEASKKVLRLRGTNTDGTFTEVTFMPQLSALERARRFLTGGSSRTWVLDNTVAATIIVGTEANPGGYYAGGPLGGLPACQADDEYTFTTGGSFVYDAKAETYVAGAYTCQAPRSDNTTYTLTPNTAGDGATQFTLNKAGTFIGVTDAPASRVYRILSIDNAHMTLRAGRSTDDPVFTIKMKVK